MPTVKIKDVSKETFGKWKDLCGTKTYKEKFGEIIQRLWQEKHKEELKDDYWA